MICPVCGNVVTTKRNHCERCGENLQVYKKMFLLSNKYYNEGLEKSKVRDLSGAILVLKKSVELNKNNTNARNLLGLIYYEMGETVSALSEWVLSKHFQAEDNDADEYMDAVQSNPTKLETLNQTIKKYNAALQSAKQGNEDLAIIQLKKVTNLNPHFVKALQLLALLYMKSGETDKAVKSLMKANRIDVSNTTTLRYLHELGEITNFSREDGMNKGREKAKEAHEAVLFPSSTYKEEKPNVWLFINLIIGIAFGILGAVFLIVPTVENNYKSQIQNNEIEYSAQLNKYTQTISSLEKEKTELEENMEQLQGEIDQIEVIEYDETLYDELLNVAMVYMEELKKPNANDIDYVTIASDLTKVNVEKLERQTALDLYNQIKEASSTEASNKLYNEGHNLYTNRKYEQALESLLQAYEINPLNLDAIYFIGRSYHQLNDNENAKIYYSILTEDYPDSNRASDAKGHLESIE